MSNRAGNKEGVTLVEVMISMVILLLVFVGLIQASLLVIDINLRNEVRDEAVRIASEYMTRTRATNWTSLTSTTPNCTADPNTNPWPNLTTVNLNYRNITRNNFFAVSRCITALDVEDLQVGIRVGWTDVKTKEQLSHAIFSNLRNK